MAFVKAKDFKNPPYKIPNQEESSGGISWLETELARIETELLEKLLGYQFYSDFISGLEVGSPEQKWKDLRDGAEYFTDLGTSQQRKNTWKGMKEMLIPGVYATFLPILYRRVYNNGTIINNGQQNTTSVVPDYEIVTSWNTYVRGTGSHCLWANTLYGFLQSNQSSYQGFVFCAPHRRNQLDI